MATELEDFKRAKTEYEAARDEAYAIVGEVVRIGSALNYHFVEFLGANYQFQIRRHMERGWAREYQMPDAWPDRAEMDRLFTRLVKSHEELHAAYDRLPPDDKAIVTAPPSEPSKPREFRS